MKPHIYVAHLGAEPAHCIVCGGPPHEPMSARGIIAPPCPGCKK